MIFNQEVDHLETMTNSHNTYLEFETVGATLDEAEGLLKRHENFLATLAAQDERMQGFSEMADKLIKAGHYNAANVDEKRRQVILKRQSVKEKATERKKVLFDSLAYQQFKAEADEFMGWCSAKMKTANDESYRDLLNVERKLQKHEVFEAEINASQSRFAAIVGKGEHLLSIKHLDSENIVQVLKSLDSKWKELCSKTVERGKGLRQAYAQLNFNRDLENAESKYTEISVRSCPLCWERIYEAARS
ncbi:Spectrin alpha chain, non-erythrocytic 1 [Halotydeus destructor]|nr:Spectrin alpha chain, non-erythrocytic 1 [Halotydeus destructor]